MNRLDRLVLSEIVAPFVGALFLFTGLFFAAGEMRNYLDFLQKGESWWIIAQIALYSFPFILAFTAPMAMLLATLLGFGRLSGDSETIALVAAGISFPRVLLPAVGFSLLVALPAYYASSTLIPRANAARQAIIDNVKKKGAAGVSTRNLVTLPVRAGDGQLLLVNAIGGVDFGGSSLVGPPRASLRHVAVSRFDKAGRLTETVYADRADWVVDSRDWVLRDNVIAFAAHPGMVLTGVAARTREYRYALGRPEQVNVLTRPENERTSAELRERARQHEAAGNGKEARAARIEIARREALPFAPVVFALVGAPLGVRPQRAGKGVGFGLSVLVTFFYWILTQITQAMGLGGTLPIWLAAQAPNLLGAIVGLYLAGRVLR